jgi:hypothetical protein
MRKLCTLFLIAGCSTTSMMMPSQVATATGTLTETLVVKATSTTPSTTCSFTLDLAGVEDASAPWLCPDCQIFYRAPMNITSGADCLSTFFANGAPPDYFFGWTANGTFHSSTGYAYASLELGKATTSASMVTVSLSLDNAQISVSGSGSFKLDKKAGDKLNGWIPAAKYSCGWPKTNPAAFSGKYNAMTGDQMPDGVLADQCGDNVRLQDLLGRYLVLAMNQTKTGCGPCDQAVAGQPKFEDDMKALGIDALVVSFLAPAYTDAELTVGKLDLTTWLGAHPNKGVALADRGYGGSVLGPWGANGDLTKIGYPSFGVVAPDGTMIGAIVGFDMSTWDSLESEIKMHAGK